MAVTTYASVSGRLRGEITSGMRTDYLTDALGSVTATLNSSATIVNTYRYKPFGQQLAKTGSGVDPRCRWTGDTGSRVTNLNCAEQYNVHRHYGSSKASWTTRDPLWPTEPPFSYGSPATALDPLGLFTITIQRFCGIEGVVAISTGAGDAKGVASGLGKFPQNPVLDAAEAIGYCKNKFPDHLSRTIVINGSLFDDVSGKPNMPVLDCQGRQSNGIGSSAEREYSEKISFGNSYLYGRRLFRDNVCLKQYVPDGKNRRARTIVVLSSAGVTVYLIPEPPGIDAEGMCKCFGPGSGGSFSFRVLHLDGGSSTQAILESPPGSFRSLIFSGRKYINNFIWLREKVQNTGVGGSD